MLPYYETKFGNASSIHSFGRESREAIDKAREQIAVTIGAEPKEIIFTSGGTESDNLAIKGISYALKGKGRHLITSQIEHAAVLESFNSLEQEGFTVSYIPVDQYGCLQIDKLEEAITPQTVLISVMHANNEVGTIQPIQEIGNLAQDNDILFHSDAVQTFGKLPIDVSNLGLSSLSLSGHKVYGPIGVGALYLREGVKMKPLLVGGGHERNLRSGTENVPGIVGLGEASVLAKKEMSETTHKMLYLRDYMIKEILETAPQSQLTGHPSKRLPNNVHLCFPGIEGEALALALDLEGIAISTGSACSSQTPEISHVLSALKLDTLAALSSIRITLGKETTITELQHAIHCILKSAERLLSISPITSNSGR
jgi:cysteine desulfurase